MSCPCNIMNEKDCPCTNNECVNHGQCCACVKRHIENNNLPVCLRPKTEEKK